MTIDYRDKFISAKRDAAYADLEKLLNKHAPKNIQFTFNPFSHTYIRLAVMNRDHSNHETQIEAVTAEWKKVASESRFPIPVHSHLDNITPPPVMNLKSFSSEIFSDADDSKGKTAQEEKNLLTLCEAWLLSKGVGQQEVFDVMEAIGRANASKRPDERQR